MESIKFRLAQIDDLENIKTMYNSIVQNMYKQNINIWNEYYPVECFEDDINNKQLYVLEKNTLNPKVFTKTEIIEYVTKWL